MSVKVNFYFFGKDPISTERPSGAPVATYDCIMLEDTSVLHPALRLRIDDADVASVIACNYAFIPLFDHYYYVAWSCSGPFWTASLDNDPLASWRTTLLDQNEYVTRAEMRHNGRIVDTSLPTVTEPIVLSAVPAADNPKFEFTYNKGTFVVGVINKDAAGTAGAVSYYAFDALEMRTFMSKMMGQIDYAYAGITEIGQNLFKSLFNPLQYVSSCFWFPFEVRGGSPVDSVSFGHWILSCPGRKLLPPLVTRMGWDFEIQAHPQASGSEYLNRPPYTQRRFSWAPIGSFELDANLLNPGKLSMYMEVDLVTGMATVEFVQGRQLMQTEFQCAVPALLPNQNPHNWQTVAGGMASAIGGAFTLDLGEIFTGLGSATTGMVAQNTYMGNNGNASKYWFDPLIQSIFWETVEPAWDVMGRPLCERVKLNDLLGGFVQVPAPRLEGIEAGTEELTELTEMLKAGVRLV